MDITESGLRVSSYLNKRYDSRSKRDAFFDECKKNLGLEAACIAACEIGELGSEVLAYNAGLEDINTPGLAGGVTLGMLYSLIHVYRHGREHSKKATLREALSYAFSTESACVLSATAVEYLAGLSTSSDPFSRGSLTIRGIALVPAFALGLFAMSGLSYFHRQEAGRFLAPGNALPDVSERLNGFLDTRLLKNGRILRTDGSESFVTVSEGKVPKSLADNRREGDSLYIVSSPVCRYDASSREEFSGFVRNLFEESGKDVRKVHNIFKH